MKLFGFSEKDKKKEEEKNSKCNNLEQDQEILDFQAIKTGEYNLHVLIQKTRGLVNSQVKNHTIDPIIQIQAFGKNKYSQIKKKIGNEDQIWGDHIFIEHYVKSKEEINNGFMTIIIKNHHSLLQDEIIGTYQLDLTQIYLEKDHLLEHKWIGITNVDQDFSKIQGFIKISAKLIHQDDKNYIFLKEETDQEEKQRTKQNILKVLFSPSVQQESYIIKVKLFRALNLKKMDLIGHIDPYIIFEYGGIEYKTKWIDNNKNPEWFLGIQLPFYMPTLSQYFYLRVFDYDRGTTDELMSTCRFKIHEIVEGKYKNAFWTNLYGSQEKINNKEEMSAMDNHPHIASNWCGCLMIAIDYEKSKNPIIKEEQMDPLYRRMYSVVQVEKLSLVLDIFFGIDLPYNNGKFKITVKWGPAQAESKYEFAYNCMINWNERLILKEVEFPITEFQHNIPDIFIYLTNKEGEHIAYWRKPYQFYLNEERKQKYVYFNPDRAVSNLRQDQAGILKVHCKVAQTEYHIPPNPFISNPEEMQISKLGSKRLICNLYQCQNLIPSSDFGNCNPLLRVSFMGITAHYPVRLNTQSPVWYRTMEVNVPYFYESQEQPPIIIRVFDQSEYGLGENFLGNAIVDINEGVKYKYINFSKEPPEAKWLNLYYNKNTVSGKVLISFNIIDDDRSPLTQLRIMPELETYEVSIKIFGLRNLKSSGLMPVKKPFIKINRNHLTQVQKYLMNLPVPKQQTKSPIFSNPIAKSQSSQTQVKAQHSYIEQEEYIIESHSVGENPNINQIIVFHQELPKNSSLVPTLSCTVHDKIFYGLYQPLIGQFTIDLQQYIEKNKKLLQKRIEKSQRFLEEISKQESSIKIEITDVTGKQEARVVKEDLIESTNKKLREFKYQPTMKLKQNIVQEIVYSEEILQKINPRNQKQKINTDFTIFWARYKVIKDKDNQIKEVSPIPNKEYYIPLSYDGIYSKQQYIKNTKKKESSIQNDEEEEEDSEIQIEQYNLDNVSAYKFAYFKGIRKHYRYFVNEKLEDTRFVRQDGDQKIIDDIDIIYQKRFSENDLYTDSNLQEQNLVKTGTFKGIINVTRVSDLDKIASVYLQKQELVEKDFLTQKNVLVRVYILEAENLPKTDMIGYCDPYLVVKLGDEIQENKKRYKQEDANPQFYEMFQFKSTLPGNPILKIQLMDYDKFNADDFMCETVIDLEERFYSNRWRKIKNPPIEIRPLYHPTSSIPRGQLKLWLEIIPETDINRIGTIYHITPKPSEEFELRCVIWSAHNIPQIEDKKSTDLSIRAIFGQQIQITDVHKKSQQNASFNWRFKFPINLPSKSTTITFQALDEDIFSLDGYICSGVLDFSKEARRAFENDERVKKYGEQLFYEQNIFSLFFNQENTKEKFEIQMTVDNESSSHKSSSKKPYLLGTFEIVPKKIAIEQHVGIGRSEPNHSPFCPEPQGRIMWSWNPIKLYIQTFAPMWRKKIFYLVVLFFILEIIILTIPAYIGSYFGTSNYMGNGKS
ncbi:hypothetical protein ABPG72_007110 [Tetrahymena utriculariae]